MSFILGFMIGSALGTLVAALCVAASKKDEFINEDF